MGGKLWRASSDGPDWMDMIAVLRAIEELHDAVVTIGLHSSSTSRTACEWHITALQVGRVGSVMGSPVVDLSGEWPCKDHSQVTHCLYAGLMRLDHVLTAKLWKQNPLPFTDK